MIDTGLKNRVILVTGANHGIGAATARAFAAQGAKVFIQYLQLSSKTTISSETSVPGEALYRANQAKTADEVLQLILAQGGQVDALEIDFATPTNIPALFDHVEKAFGPVDVLVNNAAFCQADTFIPQGNAPLKIVLLVVFLCTQSPRKLMTNILLSTAVQRHS
jgi:3-oxoacyl-[acyl-carrier protein] reductase